MTVATVIFIALSVTGRPAFAQCPPSVVPVRIVFVNGIWTWPKSQAEKSSEKLAEAITADPRWLDVIADCVEFTYSYNRLNFLGIGDLYQVLVQYFGANPSEGLRVLAGRSSPSKLFSDAMVALAESIDVAACFATGHDCAMFRDAIESAVLDDGTRTIALAHSQGNFYANQIYQLLVGGKRIPADFFSIVAVATPDPNSPIGSYVNLIDDPVANLSRLPWNANNNSGCFLFGCHLFRSSYIAGSDSRGKILDHIFDHLAGVPRDDTYKMTQGGVLIVPGPHGPNLLENDSFPATPLVLEFQETPGGGALLENLGQGAFMFTPSPTFAGTVQFKYLLHSALGKSRKATVTIQVSPLFPPPSGTSTLNVISNLNTSWTITPGSVGGSGLSASYGVAPSPSGTVFSIYPQPLLGYTFDVDSSDGTGPTLVLTPGQTKHFTITYTPTISTATEVPGTNAFLDPVSRGRSICIMSRYLADRPPTPSLMWSMHLSKGDIYPSGVSLQNIHNSDDVPSCELSPTSLDQYRTSLAVNDEIFLSVTDPDNNTVYARWTWDGTRAIPRNPARESLIHISANGYFTEQVIAGQYLYYLRWQHHHTCFSGQTLNRVSLIDGTVTGIGPVGCHGRLLTDGDYVYWLEETLPGNRASIRRVAVAGGSIETLVDDLDGTATGLLSQSIAVGGGHVYFASSVPGDPPGVQRIRSVPSAGGALTELAFAGPLPALTVSKGALYYEDTDPTLHCQSASSSGSIKRLDLSTGISEPVATAVSFACGGNSLLVDDDTLFVAHGPGIDLLSTVSTSGGTLQQRVSGLNLAFHLVVDGGFLYLGTYFGTGQTLRVDLTDFSMEALSWGRVAHAPVVNADNVYWISTYHEIDSFGGAPRASIISVPK
jgi:hypothetical protein